MRIRNRLLILLLGIALLPLLGAALLSQTSLRMMRHRLSVRSRTTLDQTSRETVMALLASHTPMNQ